MSMLDRGLVNKIRMLNYVAIDGGEDGIRRGTAISPHKIIYNSDIVVSINSTMLLEASLLNKPCISVGYLNFNYLWHNLCDIPLAKTTQELSSFILEHIGSEETTMSERGYKNAAREFSIGDFDGDSSFRILKYLRSNYLKKYRIEGSIRRHLNLGGYR